MLHSAFCVFCCIVVSLQHIRIKIGAGSGIESRPYLDVLNWI